MENESTGTEAAAVEAPKTKRAKKAAAPKAAKKVAKKAVAKKKDAKKSNGASARRGRVSDYTGKIQKLVDVEATGLRAEGEVRECWDLMKDGMSVENYRSKAPDSGRALKVLRTFVQRKFVKLTK